MVSFDYCLIRFEYKTNLIRFDKMADKNTKINDEKRLIELIREVFKEEFTQQEKASQTLLVKFPQ